jgi:shikimate kinase
MDRYSKGKIYQIVAPNGYKYIGSTICSLVTRFGNHRRAYTAWKQGKERNTTVFSLFETHGVENCKIELVEDFPCSSKKELEKREGEVIKTIECINEIIAGRTGEEYRIDNKEQLKEKFKIFYEQNRESQLQRVKDYYKQNQNRVKEQKKVYAQENADKIRERKKRYREANKEKINERRRELRRLKK